MHGVILVWLHADDEAPTWHPEIFDAVKDWGLRPVCRLLDEDYAMHCMEPSRNTFDWYHFLTVHSAISQHWRTKLQLFQIKHEVPPPRLHQTKGEEDDGTPIPSDKAHLIILDEKCHGLSFFNGLINFPRCFVEAFTSQVRFNGPLLNRFHIKLPIFGDMVSYLLI